MKAHMPGTDWHAEVTVYANGKACAEYVRPFASNDENTSIVECFIPVDVGQQITLQGSFVGSYAHQTADLVIDGSFAHMSESRSKSGIVHKNSKIKWNDALTFPYPDGWKSIELPKDCVEGNMHVDSISKDLSEHEGLNPAARRAGVGSIQVVFCANQHPNHHHQDKEWDVSIGCWKDAEKRIWKNVRNSGLLPDFEIKLENTSKVTVKRATQHTKRWRDNTRPGFKEVARFIFYYRSRDVIEQSDCVLRSDDEQQLDEWDEDLGNHAFEQGSFKKVDMQSPKKAKKSSRNEGEDGEGNADTETKAEDASSDLHSDLFINSADEEGRKVAKKSKHPAVTGGDMQSKATAQPPRSLQRQGLRDHVPLKKLGGSLGQQLGSNTGTSPPPAASRVIRPASADSSDFSSEMQHVKEARSRKDWGDDLSTDVGAPSNTEHSLQFQAQAADGENVRESVENALADDVEMTDVKEAHLDFQDRRAATSLARPARTTRKSGRLAPIEPPNIQTSSHKGRDHLKFQQPNMRAGSTLIGEIVSDRNAQQTSLPAASVQDHSDLSESAVATSPTALKTSEKRSSTSTKKSASGKTKARSVSAAKPTSKKSNSMEEFPTADEVVAAFPPDGKIKQETLNELFEDRFASDNKPLVLRIRFNNLALTVAEINGDTLVLKKKYRDAHAKSMANRMTGSRNIQDDFDPDSVTLRAYETALEPPIDQDSRPNHMQARGGAHIRDTSSVRPSTNKQTSLSHADTKSSTSRLNNTTNASRAASKPKSITTKHVNTLLEPFTKTQAASVMAPKVSPQSAGSKRTASTGTPGSEPASKRTKKDDQSKMQKDRVVAAQTTPPSAPAVGLPASASVTPKPTPEGALPSSNEARLEGLRAQLAAKKANIERINKEKAEAKVEKQRRKKEKAERKAEEERLERERQEAIRREEEELNLQLELADAEEQEAMLGMSSDGDETETEDGDEGVHLGAEEGTPTPAPIGGEVEVEDAEGGEQRSDESEED